MDVSVDLYWAMDPTQTRLDVAGISIEVSASHDYLKFVTDRVGKVGSTAAVDIEFMIGPHAPDPPDRAPDQNLEMVDAWFDDSTLWMKIGSAVAKVSEGRLEIGGSIDNPRDYKSIDLMVQFGVAAVCADRSRIMIHAAVVARGEHALIVVGKSGYGKSTASTAALLHGWELLSDDLSVANPSAGTVRGVARPPRLPTDVAHRHGMTGELEPGERGRIILDADVLAPGPRKMSALVMVGHGTEGSLERLASGDLHAIDDALAVPPFKTVMRRHLAPAAALAALPTYRLLHAEDEAIRLDRAAELLDDVLESALSEQGRPVSDQ